MNSLKFISILAVLILSSNFSVAADVPYLAERHIAKQISCENCHGKGVPNSQIKMDNCLNCHGTNYEKLAAKTDGGDINYHSTHMGEINCIECHQGHKTSRLVCDQCHEFKAKVP